MSEQPQKLAFDEDHASAYDERFARLAPFKDGLHLATRTALAELPAEARILCVGAGTGAELLYLATEFPGWTFTLVEPAAAMLARCRTKAESTGIAARCTFHEGYLDTLHAPAPFDGATSLLVSQFVLVRQKRCNFFQDIAERLVPGGVLVTADLAGEYDSPLFELWMALMRYNGQTEEEQANYRSVVEQSVAIRVPEEVEGIVMEGGFEHPVRIFQGLLIHGWCARRSH